MKYIRVIVAFWLVASGEIAVAGKFADSFRNFIVGSEAQARSSQTGPIDKLSNNCIGCHNGSIATHVNVRAAGTVAPTYGFQTRDHPMGMYYEESRRKDPNGYRATTTLHPNIRLVDGRVSCVTCHLVRNETVASLTSPEVQIDESGFDQYCTSTKEMTMGPRDRELCLACHIK